ncbi:MAG: metallophosphoesterase [Defluviitaleaceae bacterium]|nr:metallophosphoesterase [Defluviitaleaceae bacterium]MCL2836411.1 metallophosphoesterase [Defluviitaleaceae bacterium]
MAELAKIKRISIPKEKRVICVSDIHGELDLFKTLLDNTGFCDDDILVLLGDLYTKGSQCREAFKFCVELSEKPNVHILRGNADWGGDDFLSERENRWLDDLPDIIDSEEFTFVHSGLNSNKLDEHKAATCEKYDNFMETAPVFDKWVVVGHWPVAMYCHNIPNSNPIVNKEKRIIAIDGGNVLKTDGQLNAFIIRDGRFSHVSADSLPIYKIAKAQEESGGSLSVTWLDRFVEVTEERGQLCYVKHLQTSEILVVPKSQIWADRNNGKTCICDMATNYHLPCTVGDTVSLVEAFPDRIYAKKDGVSGWIRI